MPRFVTGLVFVLIGAVTLATVNPRVSAASDEQDPSIRAPSPGMALLYINREEFMGDTSKHWVFDDDRLLAVLPNNTYTAVEIEPGPHLLWARGTATMMPQLYGKRVFVFQEGEVAHIEVYGEGCWVKGIHRDSANFLETALKPLKFVTLNPKHEAKAAKMVAKRYGPEGRSSLLIGVDGDASTLEDKDSILIPRGTVVPVELEENLTSYHVRPRMPVRFRVAEEVRVDDRVAFKAGEVVDGVGGTRDRAKPPAGDGYFDVETVSTRTADGTPVRLVGLLAAGKKGPAMPAYTIEAMFVRGSDPWILAGTIFEAYTSRDVRIAKDEVASIPSSPSRPSEMRLEGTTSGPFIFPLNGRVKSEFAIVLETTAELLSIELVSVGDTILPTPTRPLRMTRQDGPWEIVFEGWQLARWARVTGARNERELLLRGTTREGRRIEVSVPSEFVVEGGL
jgi:hypothetical protein